MANAGMLGLRDEGQGDPQIILKKRKNKLDRIYVPRRIGFIEIAGDIMNYCSEVFILLNIWSSFNNVHTNFRIWPRTRTNQQSIKHISEAFYGNRSHSYLQNGKTA